MKLAFHSLYDAEAETSQENIECMESMKHTDYTDADRSGGGHQDSFGNIIIIRSWFCARRRLGISVEFPIFMHCFTDLN